MITAIITLVEAGEGSGPFNLYGDLDGYLVPFETNIPREALLLGYPVDTIPIGTNTIKIQSVGDDCFNFVEVSTLCFNFLPQYNAYITSFVSQDTYGYFYGYFLQYSESGVVTDNKHAIKLNPDLTIDTSFVSGTGFDEILYTGSAVIEQWDGRTIYTGTFTSYQGTNANRIIRLMPDGSIDTSFVYGTGFDNFTQIPIIRDDGKIIIPGIYSTYMGVSTPRLVRLNIDGSRDATLVVGSGFNNTTLNVISYSDNSILVSGYFNAYKGVSTAGGIAKVDEFGTIVPSPTFDAGVGFSPYLPFNANRIVSIVGETSFYAAGAFTSYKGVSEPYIIKILENGDKDLSFNAGTGFDGAVTMIQTVWGDKLYIRGNFNYYDGTESWNTIILNADGTIFWSSPIYYYTPIIIGNNLFGSPWAGVGNLPLCLELVFTYEGLTTTTSTTFTPTTTTTTTLAPVIIMGIISGVATTSGVLTAIGALLGTVSGTATTSGVLTSIGTLSGVSNASSTVTGILLGKGFISSDSSVNGIATVTGEIFDAFTQNNNSILLDLQNSEADDIAWFNPITKQFNGYNLPSPLSNSEDIAHTTTRLYQITQGKFESSPSRWEITMRAWDIVIEPFSAVFDRDMLFSAPTVDMDDFGIGGLGLVSKDDTTLIGSFCPNAGTGYQDAWEISEIDITDPDNVIVTRIFDLPWAPSGDFLFVGGDFLYVDNGGTPKLIVLCEHWNTQDVRILQYDYPLGTLELDINVTSELIDSFSDVFGIFQHENKIYIEDWQSGGASKIYEIDRYPPYALTDTGDVSVTIAGASQRPEGMTAVFYLSADGFATVTGTLTPA